MEKQVSDQGFVGLTKEEAFKKCKEEGITFRVMREDAETFFGTADINFNRLNFKIDNGMITYAAVG